MTQNKIQVCINTFKRGRAAATIDTLWKKSQIRVFYMDGSFELQRRVAMVARMWSNFSNITFVPATSKGESDVRVTFASGGSWSYVGTESQDISYKEPTMQLGWLTDDIDDDELRQVVLHEFGHVMGLIHEHQHPDGGIHWDKDRVYSYYMGYPNYWSRDQVDVNIFDKYEKSKETMTPFDPHSIMMYPVPKEFTTDGFSVGWNSALSDEDKELVRRLYP